MNITITRDAQGFIVNGNEAYRLVKGGEGYLIKDLAANAYIGTHAEKFEAAKVVAAFKNSSAAAKADAQNNAEAEALKKDLAEANWKIQFLTAVIANVPAKTRAKAEAKAAEEVAPF